VRGRLSIRGGGDGEMDGVVEGGRSPYGWALTAVGCLDTLGRLQTLGAWATGLPGEFRHLLQKRDLSGDSGQAARRKQSRGARNALPARSTSR
jgi:hypothetical protein